MNGPHLHPDTVAECIQAAYAYDPACYCVFSWLYAEPPPGRKYLSGTRWLQLNAWWAMGEQAADQHLLVVTADSGPELLHSLRGALAGLGPSTGPPAPPKPPAPPQPLPVPYQPPQGNGWIASAPQTTQALNCWP
jgi:hypothetical protein